MANNTSLQNLVTRAKSCDPEGVTESLAMIASLDPTSQPSRAAFIYSCAFGTPHLLTMFTDRGMPINCTAGYFTPLIMAAKHGNSEAVKWLLTSGADIQVVGEFEEPVLSIMCEPALFTLFAENKRNHRVTSGV